MDNKYIAGISNMKESINKLIDYLDEKVGNLDLLAFSKKCFQASFQTLPFAREVSPALMIFYKSSRVSIAINAVIELYKRKKEEYNESFITNGGSVNTTSVSRSE